MAAAACGPAASSTAPTGAATPDPATATAPASAPAASPAAASPYAGAASPYAGALTIAALGDSLTAGECDDSGLGGYPGRLQTLGESLRPGTRIVNLGHSGWSTADLINGLNGDPSPLAQAVAMHPQAALVWIGSNDLWYLYEYGPDPMTPEAEAADLAVYAAGIDTVAGRLTSAGATVFLALLDDQSKRPFVARPNPTEPAFPATTRGDLALMSVHIAAYNDILRRTAARYGGDVVDFSATTIFTDKETLCDDGNHPNAVGYDRIAAIWLAALKARFALAAR